MYAVTFALSSLFSLLFSKSLLCIFCITVHYFALLALFAKLSFALLCITSHYFCITLHFLQYLLPRIIFDLHYFRITLHYLHFFAVLALLWFALLLQYFALLCSTCITYNLHSCIHESIPSTSFYLREGQLSKVFSDYFELFMMV